MVKMPVLLKVINRFHATPIKIPVLFFTEVGNSVLKFRENKRTLNSKSNPEEKGQYWRHHNTRLQIILQSHSNKNNKVLA
jgi:hypothetical protein